MMSAVFADSGYFIALLQPDDRVHRSARAMSTDLEDDAIVTTEMVLVELFSHMSRRGETARLAAHSLVSELRNDPHTDIVPQTTEQFRAAAELYAARADQRWSLTDCASFLVMQERGISEALAYDRDFEQAGFVALLRVDPD